MTGMVSFYSFTIQRYSTNIQLFMWIHLLVSLDGLLKAFENQIWRLCIVLTSHVFANIHRLQSVALLIFVCKTISCPSSINWTVKIIEMATLHVTMNYRMDLRGWHIRKVSEFKTFHLVFVDRIGSLAWPDVMHTFDDRIFFKL